MSLIESICAYVHSHIKSYIYKHISCLPKVNTMNIFASFIFLYTELLLLDNKILIKWNDIFRGTHDNLALNDKHCCSNEKYYKQNLKPKEGFLVSSENKIEEPAFHTRLMQGLSVYINTKIRFND